MKNKKPKSLLVLLVFVLAAGILTVFSFPASSQGNGKGNAKSKGKNKGNNGEQGVFKFENGGFESSLSNNWSITKGTGDLSRTMKAGSVTPTEGNWMGLYQTSGSSGCIGNTGQLRPPADHFPKPLFFSGDLNLLISVPSDFPGDPGDEDPIGGLSTNDTSDTKDTRPLPPGDDIGEIPTDLSFKLTFRVVSGNDVLATSSKTFSLSDFQQMETAFNSSSGVTYTKKTGFQKFSVKVPSDSLARDMTVEACVQELNSPDQFSISKALISDSIEAGFGIILDNPVECLITSNGLESGDVKVKNTDILFSFRKSASVNELKKMVKKAKNEKEELQEEASQTTKFLNDNKGKQKFSSKDLLTIRNFPFGTVTMRRSGGDVMLASRPRAQILIVPNKDTDTPTDSKFLIHQTARRKFAKGVREKLEKLGEEAAEKIKRLKLKNIDLEKLEPLIIKLKNGNGKKKGKDKQEGKGKDTPPVLKHKFCGDFSGNPGKFDDDKKEKSRKYEQVCNTKSQAAVYSLVASESRIQAAPKSREAIENTLALLESVPVISSILGTLKNVKTLTDKLSKLCQYLTKNKNEDSPTFANKICTFMDLLLGLLDQGSFLRSDVGYDSNIIVKLKNGEILKIGETKTESFLEFKDQNLSKDDGDFDSFNRLFKEKNKPISIVHKINSALSKAKAEGTGLKATSFLPTMTAFVNNMLTTPDPLFKEENVDQANTNFKWEMNVFTVGKKNVKRENRKVNLTKFPRIRSYNKFARIFRGQFKELIKKLRDISKKFSNPRNIYKKRQKLIKNTNKNILKPLFQQIK